MRQAEVFFHPMEGSGQLSISWSSGWKGAAVEAKIGNGVGFFSSNGELLSVIFDDVSVEDHQFLEFSGYTVEVIVCKGKVTYKVSKKILPARKSHRPTKKAARPKVKKRAKSRKKSR